MHKSVLLVDDNALIRHALHQSFTSQADLEVCGEAENGLDAIEKAQELHPDVIIMDLSMPVMNGLDAARALKKLMPATPLIMFSHYCDVFSANEARSAGVTAFVSKSDHLSVLIDKVRVCAAYSLRDFFSQSGKPRLSCLITRRIARASPMACRSAWVSALCDIA
jgi:DNA-binding NarL/FixJ family response regulator